MNKLNIYILRLTMLLALALNGAGVMYADTWDGTSVATAYAGGNGTEANPHIIETAAQLAYFANQCHGKTYWVKLNADIDLGGNYWVNGTTTKYGSGKEFKGKFIADKKADGTNYTISNFKLLVPNVAASYGLFSKVTGGIIRNVDVKDVTIDFASNISVQNTYVGALVGSTGANTVVENCHVTGVTMSLKGISASSGMGGLIGYLADKTTVTNCGSKDFTMESSGDIKAGYIAALIGYTSGKAHAISGCTVTNANSTVKGVYQGANLGSLIGLCQGAGATTTTRAKVTDCTVNGSTIAFEKTLGANSYVAHLVANLKNAEVSGCKVIGTNEKSCSITLGKSIVNTNVITGNTFIGGFVGYMQSGSSVSNCSSAYTSFTVNGNIGSNAYLGGLIGNVQPTTSVSSSSSDHATFALNGTCASTRLGGLIGYIVGNAASRNVIQGCSAISTSVSIGGTLTTADYIGGLVGFVDKYVNILNNKVEAPAIAINGAINIATYLSGGVAYLSTYDTLDGLYVKGGNITGSSTMQGVKNGIEFFVGGALAKQVSANATSAATQQSQARNLAVEGMNIDFGNLQPAAGVMSGHKFIVGGIIGQSLNSHGSADESGIPQNLISKDVKIYAPQAMTSPLVGGFGTPGYTNYTLDHSGSDDDVTKSRAGSWVYSGYKLGLSDAVLSNAKVLDSGTANPGAGNVTRNFATTDITTEDGISYITMDKLQKTNRYVDFEYTSKTVLWWTNPSGSATSANSNIEQYIYPKSDNGTTGLLTGTYNYTMYFYQGVNHGKEVTTEQATALISGIDGGIAHANDVDHVTLTISDAQEKVRGFGNHTISVAASNAHTYTYKWYVDGVEATEGISSTLTGSALSIAPDWRFGKGIVVNALDGSDIVASASYTLKHGVLKTKNSANLTTDYVGMPTAQRGTQDNPYIIDCPEALHQLSWLSTLYTSFYWETLEKLSSDVKTACHSSMHFNRAYYELENDIDLGNSEFTPISHSGTSTSGTYHQNYVFCGHFDGKGFAIRNFKITWRGGQYNAGGCQYYGLFGAVGWGAISTAETCVIQNLIIDNAQLVHDTSNTSFYYNNGTSGNANHVMVGALAGVVSNNTAIQNIEVRNSKISDDGSLEFKLGGKILSVGGIIGRVQYAFGTGNTTDKIPQISGITLRYLSSNCDVDIQHAEFSDIGANGQMRLFDVGGIVGSMQSTGTATTIPWPQYTYYTGVVKARNAFVSPSFGSVDYSGNTSNDFQYYYRHYMAKTTDATQDIPNLYFGNYQIQTYTSSGASDLKTITATYPAVGCSDGSRTITLHNYTHPNNNAFYTGDNYYGEYQGVNYGEYINTTGQKTSLEILFEEAMNVEGITGYYLIFDGNQMQLVKTKPFKVSILDNTTDAKATSHALQVVNNKGNDDFTYIWYSNGQQVSTATTYDAPIGTSPQLIYVAAYEVSTNTTKNTEAIALPRSITEFTASYTPQFKREVTTATVDYQIIPKYLARGNEVVSPAGYSLAYQWKELSGDQWIDLLSTKGFITAVDVKNIYKCTITATDSHWQTFIASLTNASSPYYALKDAYPATFTYEVIVRLHDLKVVFLHPNANAETFGGITIPAGNDNWGSISDGEIGDKDHPVATWGKAYSLLDGSVGSTWDDNIIVLVGTSTANQTWGVNSDGTRCVQPTETSEYGLSNLFANGTVNSEIDALRYDQYIAKIAASPMGKNVTITGMYDGVDYNAKIESPLIGTTTVKLFMHFYGNTKFEYLTFYGGAREYDVIFGHYHDLWFGDGLIMKNMKRDEKEYGTMKGLVTPRLQVFGGMHMDKRFNLHYDAATGQLDEMLQKTVPNGEKGFTLTFRSGFFSIICPGSRQVGNAGMQGSPNMPIKCTIDVDFDQDWNKAHQMGTMTNSGGTGPDENICTPYDIALIMAGNHEGPIYADVDIKVKSGRIGRIVNGSLGALRDATYKYGGGTKNYPKNTFFGRANILLDPASSRFASSLSAGKTIDDLVVVTELYNGGVGRALGSDTGEINMPSISKNTVLIKGGTIGFPEKPSQGWTDAQWMKYISQKEIICGLYGGGAGGMNGIGYGVASATTHVAADALLPYWEDDARKVFAYCNYETYITITGTKHLTIKCYNADTNDYTYFDPLDTSSEITIEGGKIGTASSPASIFGAGSGFTSMQFLADDKASYPNTLAGNMYGRSKDAIVATVNIKGGTIYGNVYGAGRGTDYYYVNNRSKVSNWSSLQEKYKELGQTYGSVVTNITGGTIYGNVYGAGAGVAEAKKYNKNTYGQFTETAFLSGNATVNISENAQIKSYIKGVNSYGGNVYGGGMLAKVAGNTAVNISGNTQIDGNVFGAAQGITNLTSTNNQNIPGTLETYLLVTADSAKFFGIVEGNANLTISGTPIIGGDIYGGAESAITEGNTFVTIDGGTINNVYGGGLGSLNGNAISASADVHGNTQVNMNKVKTDSDTLSIYGGGNQACQVHNTQVTLKSAVDHKQLTAFGGGYGSNTRCDSTFVSIELPDNKESDLDVYGGGNQGVVTSYTQIVVNQGDVDGNIYGGGYLGDVEGNTKVVIKSGTVEGNVFGGGKGEDGTDKAKVTGNTAVIVDKDWSPEPKH